MSERVSIGFLYHHPSTFVMRDVQILSEFADVKQVMYRSRGDIPHLVSTVLRTNLNFSWFVLGFARATVRLSKLLRKKSIVVAGGFDVASIPELDYGMARSRRDVKRTRYVLENATKVLAVSTATQKDVLRLAEDVNVEVVHHGFDTDEYSPRGEKEKLVLTVANVSDQNLRLKGLSTFIEASRRMRDTDFVIVGECDERVAKTIRKESSGNLQLTGRLSTRELLEYYRKAKVYCQLSYHESFGCALAEAMLCECVPVVTNRGAIPEVAGDAGVYVEYGNIEETVEGISKALESDSGSEARDRIVQTFPLSKRKDAIRKVIEPT